MGARERLGLLLVLGLTADLVACAKAQVDEKCVAAAALWIPSNTSIEKVVVKWSKSPKYDIIIPNGEKPDIVHTINSTLLFVGRQSGLEIEPVQHADLVIAVADDISEAAPKFRKSVEDFLQPAIFGYQQKMEIDPKQWGEKFRDASPRCNGIDFFVNGAIMRAYVLLQEDAGTDCVNISLGEVFGLINIRTYYHNHNGRIPEDLTATALRTLYDTRVPAGSNAESAEKIVGEVCRGT